ncbi:leucine-rich repeat-containing protein 14 [Scleropages formosus]|uniref:Leucine-rich repeat-containing protein 14 n=1 Tax=Scleropages formosus TaxID=113540 RepID=A0A8C9WE46_SCLFO|nr:leucine-rich repeat-containing protein 14-like [Scleropages formosus]
MAAAVPSLLALCARRVVSDHSSSPRWLSCVPRELYRELLEAAFAHCRPLAVGELVRRWPERALRVGGRRRAGQSPPPRPHRLCVQALLLAVVRGLENERCALQVLDLCGLQCEEGGMADSMGGWSLTVALCSIVLQARVESPKGTRREKERKRLSEVKREQDSIFKRERSIEKKAHTVTENSGEVQPATEQHEMEEDLSKGVRRKMEMAQETGGMKGKHTLPEVDAVPERVQVWADLFVTARSWERVRMALSVDGPLRLYCQQLRVEELPASKTVALLSLLPRSGLLGLDIRYSSLGVSGLALLLPALAPFPSLSSLRLHYCNLDLRRDVPGQEGMLRDMALGLKELKNLRQLSLTALRLPGHLRMLLSALSQPLEVLELPYLSLTPADLSYLSCSPHASSLRRLDLSENRLEEVTLPSLRRLLSHSSSSLTHLSLCGCNLSDGLLGLLLPSLCDCRALRVLRVALNPLSRDAVLSLVSAACRIPSLQLLLYPSPLEDYQPGLPPAPSSAQLLDWPLSEELEGRDALQVQLRTVLSENGRSDLLLTSDLLNYNSLLHEED